MSDVQGLLQSALSTLVSTLLAQPYVMLAVAAALTLCLALVVASALIRRRRRIARRANAASTPAALSHVTLNATLPPASHASTPSVPLRPLVHTSPAAVLRATADESRSTEHRVAPAPAMAATAVLIPDTRSPETSRGALHHEVAVAPAAAATATLAPQAPVDLPSPEALAEQEYRQGLRLLTRQGTEREPALRAALTSFRRAQEYWTRERAPERWAAIQNDIGRVYQELPVGDRAHQVQTAILHHESALEVFDPASHPMSWAWTQAALGAAYLSNPRGSAIANARAAIAYYQRALDVFTPENAPLAWAWNQNNLGAAFETLRGAEGERAACLRDAAHCYEVALRVFTDEAYPAQHQLVARNLARVQAELRALE